ncbi:MAG: peptidylprolyl isomerase [Candidatus Sumerlaeaceae bacterium]
MNLAYVAILAVTFALLTHNSSAQPKPAVPQKGDALANKPIIAPAGAGTTPRAMYQLEGDATTGPITLAAGTYAVFHTSEGDFIVTLFTQQAPNTTKNFIDLALGRKAWKHPVTMVESKRPLYNNTTFYRIIEDTMVFGGDPINKGAGDSGTVLPLEISPGLQFDGGGLLAMDGSGSQSSGSRWFIALRPFPDRNGRYTIIGKVAGGIDVVRAISNKPTKKPQMPLDATLLSSIEIVEIPAGKLTTASFRTEDNRPVLSVDPNFAAAQEPKPLAPADDLTTSSDVTTVTATDTTTTATVM